MAWGSASGPPGGPATPALEKKRSIGPCASVGLGDQLLQAVLVADVDRRGVAAEAVRHAAGGLAVQVGHDDGAGALGGEAADQRTADPARCARDHDVSVSELHRSGTLPRGVTEDQLRRFERHVELGAVADAVELDPVGVGSHSVR